MRTILLLVLALASAICTADQIRLTLYDDGRSCPGNCDAHVVFHSTLNGTEYAHLPGSSSSSFKKCLSGQACTICLESGLKQCMEAMYRGSGPPGKTFDLTPAFYAENCPNAEPYPILHAKCQELRNAEQALAGKTNCIKKPDAPQCAALMAAAQSAAMADKPLYDECLAKGEAEFNASQPAATQRRDGCAYEKNGTGGPNSKGKTWRKLLPAACREGTFVGRDGLDCCSGVTFVDGPLGRECRHFYPQ